MRKLTTFIATLLIACILTGCGGGFGSPQVESGPFKGYEVFTVIDKFEERKGVKWVVQVTLNKETFTSAVSKEEFDRAFIGGPAYYGRFTGGVIIPRVMQEDPKEYEIINEEAL